MKDRSENEVRSKMTAKGYSETEIAETLESLKQADLLNDLKTAKSLLRYLEDTKLLSRRACINYLKTKGITDNLIEELDFSESKEIEKAKNFLEKKRIDKTKYTQNMYNNKIYTLLQRRGFDSEIIIHVIKENDS
ncbi:Regulatory protein RecX [Candidatus Magnetoovum chiemensis]|nr:Regulatory protein RecX [Candidatus Magnetoovum chiemensis]